jgi:hypothetical protein
MSFLCLQQLQKGVEKKCEWGKGREGEREREWGVGGGQ